MIDLQRATGGFNEIDVDIGVIEQNNPADESIALERTLRVS